VQPKKAAARRHIIIRGKKISKYSIGVLMERSMVRLQDNAPLAGIHP